MQNKDAGMIAELKEGKVARDVSADEGCFVSS